MAIDNPPGWLQNAGAVHTAEQLRTYIGATLAGKGTPSATTLTRNGVQLALGAAMAVSANGTPNMSVNVGTGVAFIQGSESVSQGMYIVRSGTTTNLTIATAPGAGLNRIDLVVAQVQDSQYSGATDTASFAVITGTAASSPAAPTASNNSIILAQVFVGSNVTSITGGNITDRRPFAASMGGNIYCASTGRPGNLYDGLQVFEFDTNLFSWSDGSTWFPQSQWVQGNNIWAIPTTVNNFTSTSYVNLTLNSVVQTISFTKRYASTRLKITWQGSGFVSVAPTICTWGVSINGADQDICKMNYNAATSHISIGSTRYMAGFAAGAITATMRIKVGSNQWSMDTNDTFSLTIEEVQ